MLVWYWREDKEILNLGEHITPIICDHFKMEWKDYCKRDDTDKEVLIIIGSELHKHKMNTFTKAGIKTIHVWGQGKGHGEVFDKEEYDVRFHLVRGNRTRDEYGLECPTGDPGFILPQIVPFKHKKLFGITYAPHHSNSKGAIDRALKMGCKDYFDVMIHRGMFYDRLKRLISSEFVLTNSLHVMIICRAYNVPFAISLLEGENLSFPPKWLDVCDWLGFDFETVTNYQDGFYWWNEVIKGKDLPDVKPIMDSFPFKK